MRPVDKARRDVAGAKNPEFDRGKMEGFFRIGFSYGQIAEIMGCSELTVRYALDSKGYSNQPKRETNYKNWSDEALFMLHQQGKNDTEMAEILGSSRNAVSQFREKMGLKPHFTRRRKSKKKEKKTTPKATETMQRPSNIISKEGEFGVAGGILSGQISFRIPQKPMTRKEWNQKRISTLGEWISYQVLKGNKVEAEIMREYQALTEVQTDQFDEVRNDCQGTYEKIQKRNTN